MTTLADMIRDQQAIWDDVHSRDPSQERVLVVEVLDLTDSSTGRVATAIGEDSGEPYGVDYYRGRYGELIPVSPTQDAIDDDWDD